MPPPSDVLTAMTAAQTTGGILLLALGTSLIGLCVFVDMAGAGATRDPRLWGRPLVLLPVALASIILGSLLLGDR